MDTMPFTELLDLRPLPVTALKNPLFEQLYSYFKFFNPIQTQVFFSLYQTDKNILIGAPTGSGKTIMSELAILHLMKERPELKTVYIAPLKALVRERLKDW
jgi:activating signal cointegrator complex subunit 3